MTAAIASRSPSFIDRTGERFGRLVVCSRTRGGTSPRWDCLCDCGKTTNVAYCNLKSGRIKSCGCLKAEGYVVSLLGKRYGKLLVTRLVGLDKRHRAMWECACDCGDYCVTLGNTLSSGRAVSCGCRKTTHGMTGTNDYGRWNNMVQRCTNENHPEYASYGGRGILVCDSWRNSFETFFADVGPCPSPEHSLDRIDVNGNYEPGNVRWATQEIQANNKRNTKTITWRGKSQTMAQWARELGIPPSVLRKRLTKTSAAVAFTTPFKPRKRHLEVVA